MVEVTNTAPGNRQHFIQPDIQEFVSPVDGTVIKSRTHLRRYMKANNLAHHDDFKDSWEARRSERLKYKQGRDRKSIEQRISALRDSFEQVRNTERARRQYG
jgi:hypothetical protein